MKTQNTNITDIRMVRGSGYGQYSISVEFSALNFEDEMENFKLKFHSTNSQLWDDENKTDEILLNEIGGEQALLDRI
jgi:hypothetical protein